MDKTQSTRRKRIPRLLIDRQSNVSCVTIDFRLFGHFWFYAILGKIAIGIERYNPADHDPKPEGQ